MQFNRTFLLISLCLASQLVIAQDFEKKFKELQIKKDTAGQVKLLQTWERSSSKDPELFIAYFNYYVAESMTDLISLDISKKGNQSLQLSDTATGQPVGYLNAAPTYNSE